MRGWSVRAGWGLVAAGLGLAAAVFIAFRNRFDYAFDLIDIPAVPLAIGLALAGLLMLPLPMLVTRSRTLAPVQARQLLFAIIAIGFALRGILFVTEPALEDDYHRYLWDGAVTAHGMNPYALAPATAAEEGELTAIGRLALSAGVVMERINHPDLKTIYPPVSQAAFALAHLVSPWSVGAWRLVCLAGETATLLLLLALLSAARRDQLWVALYWWNPLIIKEMINSAHMEAILLPLVLAALLLAVRQRPFAAIAMLGAAAGAKLWPVLLAPLLLRPLLRRRQRLMLACALLAALIALWSWPVWVGGINESSGFVAFANHWQTNSALFPATAKAVDLVLTTLQLAPVRSGLVARALLGLIVAATAFAVAWRPWTEPSDLMNRVLYLTATLLLLSPAQFPWYAAWMMPFLAFRPSLALLALSALLPIYYVSFHFLAREQYDTFRYGLVWLIWLPVWAGLAAEWWLARRREALDA